MIKLGEIYKDKSGRDVRIICVDRKEKYSVIGLINGDAIHCYTAKGTYHGIPVKFDLVLPEDFSTYVIDEPVMVRDHDKEEWLRRYFAGVKADKPCAWDDGATSWSVGSPDHMLAWDQCRRPTKEELGEEK